MNARIPSALSTVASGQTELRFYAGQALAATLSYTTSPDVVVLRTFFGPAPTVSRGDVLDPGWRRWLATDLRLCYWLDKLDRVALLQTFTDMAAAWDAHVSTASGGGAR